MAPSNACAIGGQFTTECRGCAQARLVEWASAGSCCHSAGAGCHAACDVERRKSDAELGLNPQQSAGRKIYDARCDRCHEPYSTRGKKGPGLKGMFQHKYLSLSGLPANDERVTDIIRLRPQRNARLQPDPERAGHSGSAGVSAYVVASCYRSHDGMCIQFSWDNSEGMKSAAKSELFRELPSVDELVAHARGGAPRIRSRHLRQSPPPRAPCWPACANEIASGLLDAPALRIALGGLGRRDRTATPPGAHLLAASGDQRHGSHSAYQSRARSAGRSRTGAHPRNCRTIFQSRIRRRGRQRAASATFSMSTRLCSASLLAANGRPATKLAELSPPSS